MSAPALVGVDWGTSSFRAFLIGAGGAILDRRAGPFGILSVEPGGFPQVLRRETAAWRAERDLPVMLSGMVGSRQGWAEAAYLEAPAALSDLAGGLLPAPGGHLTFIAPGVADMAGPLPEVMRGEEVQIAGAAARTGRADGCFVIPGTHSKWVRVEAGAISRFATYMTGEVFAACRQHTILGRLMAEGAEDRDAFLAGVDAGARAGGPGALLNRLFGVRTAGLFDRIPAAGLADYMSGLLIGAEIADGLAGPLAPDGPPVVIGSDGLAGRYAAALARLGRDVEKVDPDCVAAGHLAIARAAGIVG